MRCGLGVALVLLAGCGSEQPAAPNRENAEQAVRIPQTASFVLNDGAGLLNGGFEYWVEGVPLHWETRPGMARHVEESTDAVSGKSCLTMKGGYTYNHVRQVVEASDSLAGKTVTARVNVKTSESKALIGFKLDNGSELGYTEHPGDGQWHTVVATHTFADAYTANTFQVVLNHSGAPGREALFDDATLEVD